METLTGKTTKSLRHMAKAPYRELCELFKVVAAPKFPSLPTNSAWIFPDAIVR